MVKRDEEGKLYLSISPYLKYAITIILFSFFGWLVFQLDEIRDSYPTKYVLSDNYIKDKLALDQQICELRQEQVEQRKLSQSELNSMRSEMNAGFRETRELIIKLNSVHK